MINFLTLAGAVAVAIGIALLLLGIGQSLQAIFRRSRYRRRPLQVAGEGVWSGAVTAREVYVPGTIAGKLAKALAGLLVVALGLPLLWAGLLLGSFTRVDRPQPLARVTVSGSHFRVVHSSGESVEGSLTEPVIVAHAEFIEFGGPLERLGLGRYARLTHLTGYRSRGDVLNRKGGMRLDVAGRRSLHATMERAEKWLPEWVQATLRFSSPLPEGAGEVELWGSAAGLEWRH